MMLLNFKDVEELRLIEDALYQYLKFMDYCYDFNSDSDDWNKYLECKELIEKFAEEIEYYDTSEQKD